MEYEVVQLEKKRVAGMKLRTSNQEPDMASKIGGLWQRFYAEGVYQTIPGKKNERSIGLYTNYENGDAGPYDVVVCCEVEEGAALPAGVEAAVIPAGTYARFKVRGRVDEVVGAFWSKLWTMDLNRAFGGDFEEYLNDSMEDAEIDIYIAVKE